MNHLYLSVLEDRHIDNLYHVFSSPDAARTQCKAWINEYEDQYDWEEIPMKKYFYSAWSGDDGPSVYVEKIPFDEGGTS